MQEQSEANHGGALKPPSAKPKVGGKQSWSAASQYFSLYFKPNG
jgi:hypothetical protein